VTRAVSGAVLSALVIVCLAGCGGKGHGSSGPTPLTKAAYDRQMTAIGRSLGEAFAPVGAATTAPEAQAALSTVEGELTSLQEKARAITAPTPLTADQALLVTAFGEIRSELNPLIAKLRSGDLQALNSITSLKGIKDLATAVHAISKAGYSIEG
jgi:hypothetical protein